MIIQNDVPRNMGAIKINIISGICVVAILFVHASCSNKQSDENNIPADNSAENEITLPISSPSEILSKPTNTPEIEPALTPMLTPIPKQLNIPDNLNVSGTIWVLDAGDEYSNVLKLDLTKHTFETVPFQVLCKGMITRRAVAICQKSPESEFQVFHLETGLGSKITEVDHGIIRGYLDSHFFVVMSLGPNDTYTYQFMDLDSDEEYSFSLKRENLVAGEPRISYDGKYIANYQGNSQLDYRVLLYDSETGTNSQISDESFYTSYDYSWSPVNSHIVYGATDYLSEIGMPITQINLFSVESWESTVLYKAPGDQHLYLFGSNTWSPAGDFIAIGQTDRRFCILGIHEDFEQCYDIYLRSNSWSPDSRYFAFFSSAGETPWIGILDVVTGEVYSIFEGQDFGESVYLSWVEDLRE